MYLDSWALARIEHIFSRINAQIMLLDTSGQVILPADNHREFQLPEALTQNPTKPLVYGGFTLIGTSEAQPLYLCMAGDSLDVSNCIVACAEMISMIVASGAEHLGREQTIRMILRGEVDGNKLESVALEQNLAIERNRAVLQFRFTEMESETALAILKNIVNSEEDILVEVGRHSIALVKALGGEDEDYDELEQLGLATVNTFLTESSETVYVGIGDPVESLSGLSESFKEARSAIEVGRLYRQSQQVFVYRRLVLERFLGDVPDDMAKKYNALLFNRKTARLFNDEMIQTIHKFFENSLNLSETARQLYIHRNTLVYRLDKIQRNIGLDLRAFDDAVTFKLMMQLGKNSQNSHKR